MSISKEATDPDHYPYICESCTVKLPSLLGITRAVLLPLTEPFNTCAICKTSFGNTVKARTWRRCRRLTCDGCGTKSAIAMGGIACRWCYDAFACSEKCWLQRVWPVHRAVCAGHVTTPCYEHVDDSDACGARAAHSHASGRSSHTYSHWHRHPDISPQKARMILHDGSVRGHALTPKQQRLFGYMAGLGKKR
jgi:hypothetical protein